MAYSEKGGKVAQYVKPNEFAFLMHVEAMEGFEEFALGANLSWESA
jgi:hypothetical protein